jgi:hypothetical protein
MSEICDFLCLSILLFVIFFCGLIIGISSDQDIIDRFEKSPICIEQKVGTEVVRNCYTLTKVTK